jgi:hypothetical protein
MKDVRNLQKAAEERFDAKDYSKVIELMMQALATNNRIPNSNAQEKKIKDKLRLYEQLMLAEESGRQISHVM